MTLVDHGLSTTVLSGVVQKFRDYVAKVIRKPHLVILDRSPRRVDSVLNIGASPQSKHLARPNSKISTIHRQTVIDKCQVTVPSVFQFGVFFSDLGIGIKAHLEKAYPVIPTHQDAIIYALRPKVSGTFRQQSAYGVRDNAGMGLTYSSLLLKRLKGDMYIVSHDGLAHVSPEDVTTRSLNHTWPSTFVLINLSISDAPQVSLEDLLSEIRVKAETELGDAEEKEQADKFYVNIQNYFGKWAEDKDAAISFRDRRLLPAILEGKRIELDFRGVETAPHSFLNALLATPVQRLGVKAYQWIHVHNAIGSIHEVVRTIFEDNLPELK